MNVFVGVIVLVLIILLPLIFMVWRFKRGGEMVAGGSDGKQFLGRDDP